MLSFLVATALGSVDRLPSLPKGQSFRPVWADEFVASELDTAKWDYPDGPRRDGVWSRRAISVKDGKMVIRTFLEDNVLVDGCAHTRGKFSKAFGYFVAKIKLQSAPGHWSAFWLNTDRIGEVDGTGRDGSEIDIMEKPWLDDRVNHALHWDGYGKDHRLQAKVVRVPGVMKGWHTYGLLWTPERYIFYVDGIETWRSTAGGVCQTPVFIKLSDEVQRRGWAGLLDTSRLPDQFETDYVRVYDVVDAQGQLICPQ